MIPPKDLAEIEEWIAEQEPPRPPYGCSHTYFDGRTAWQRRGFAQDGNYVRQCALCGEIDET